jgi:hypothetical protein
MQSSSGGDAAKMTESRPSDIGFQWAAAPGTRSTFGGAVGRSVQQEMHEPPESHRRPSSSHCSLARVLAPMARTSVKIA